MPFRFFLYIGFIIVTALFLVPASSDASSSATFSFDDDDNDDDDNNRIVLASSFDDDTTSTVEIRNVLDYGAIGDGVSDDTMAIRRALEEVIVLGSVIVWLPGNYIFLSQPLNISSYTTFQIDGTLRSLNHEPSWPRLAPLPNYNTSDDLGYSLQYQSLLYASHAHDIVITGSGVVDGVGNWWWDAFSNDRSLLHAGRPNLVQTLNCSTVEISHVTFRDAPFLCLHPALSVDIWIHHVTIRARTYAPNSDGIDPDSCRHVLLEYNDVGCGDDHIAIKAGRCGSQQDHLSCHSDTRFSRGLFVTENITIRHNIFRNGMGIAIGSESSGSIRNVHIHDNQVGVCHAGHDCVTETNRRSFLHNNKYNKRYHIAKYHNEEIKSMPSSSSRSSHNNNNNNDTNIPNDASCCGWGPGLHIKTTVSRGGVIEHIKFANNIVYNTSMFLLLESHYQNGGSDSLPDGYEPTKLHNISFLGNTAAASAFSVIFDCPVVSPCRDIRVRDTTILNHHQNNPWSCHNVDTFTVQNNTPPGLEECLQNSSSSSSSSLPRKIE